MTVDQQHTIDKEPIHPPVNPGKDLRAGREQRGLSVADAAASLRLPVKTLEHIEAGRFEALPGNTFSRGYVRSYARLLGLDANRLVVQFDQFVGAEEREGKVGAIDTLNKPVRRGLHFTRLGSLLVVLAVIASGVLWWHESRMAQPVLERVDQVVQSIEEVEVDASPMPLVIQGEVALPLTSVADNEPDSLPEPTAEAAPAETEPESAVVTETQAQAPVPATTSSDGLSMQFSASCWVEITAADGRVLHSALMQPGQQLQMPASGPVEVLVGAIESVSRFHYQGQPVTIPSSNRSGVVRLRLGQ
ncbi:MAG: hypothetical protein CVV07_05015 [Gammaproteobacteria bacterium HGW-Gammaproteobacteria-11]|nr:MAG: hypothetical protein CVV07_05015 [Gammaproteobacteria bacterium HGW-Gammaproteobacteria-11]